MKFTAVSLFAFFSLQVQAHTVSVVCPSTFYECQSDNLCSQIVEDRIPAEIEMKLTDSQTWQGEYNFKAASKYPVKAIITQVSLENETRNILTIDMIIDEMSISAEGQNSVIAEYRSPSLGVKVECMMTTK